MEECQRCQRLEQNAFHPHFRYIVYQPAYCQPNMTFLQVELPPQPLSQLG